MQRAIMRTSHPAGAACSRTGGCGVRPFGGALLRPGQRYSVVRHAQPEQQQQQQETKPGSPIEDLPPWVRREKEREMQAQSGSVGLPWALCLLFSVFTAIAAVGSIFEFVDRNAIFGVVQPDSPFWAPILLFFAVSGFPTAGFLFIKGVQGFNEDAERQDKLDGYL